ncbi:MAG: hypothetical protein ACE5DM_01185 [Candidatus Nanoarchaeia archaeon]
MKSIAFDTGPVISLTTNNLLWLLSDLKKEFGGEFLVTDSVEDELISKPLRTKKFKFEALQVKKIISEGILRKFSHDGLNELADSLYQVANSIYSIRGRTVSIVQYAEMEVLAAALLDNSVAIVIDERTTRKLVEDPKALENILKHKLHAKVWLNERMLKRFQSLVKGVRIIRSVELVTIAFEKGLLDKYLPGGSDGRRTLLESILWGVKLHGCSVSHIEIDKIVKLESKK